MGWVPKEEDEGEVAEKEECNGVWSAVLHDMYCVIDASAIRELDSIACCNTARLVKVGRAKYDSARDTEGIGVGSSPSFGGEGVGARDS